MPTEPKPTDLDSDQASAAQLEIVRFEQGRLQPTADVVAREEPLEIRVVFGPSDNRRSRSLSITMRTPGSDVELAAGFLLTEGIVRSAADIVSHEFCGPPPEGSARGNTLLVELATSLEMDLSKLQRHFYTTSSCGVCGKASLDAVRAQGLPNVGKQTAETVTLSPDLICDLPARLRRQQAVFDDTGGLHAAGLFNASGELIDLREDVGRHNAVDKLLGVQLLSNNLPLSQNVLVVSGRASFELVQKALMGGIPAMVAVGAPSSLAVELADEFGMTLIGFTSAKRFNVYSVAERVVATK